MKCIKIFICIFLLYIIFIYKKIYHIQENFTNKRLCLFYAYYEKDKKYKNNFIFFLNNGILDEIDYYIIINGNCSVDIPKKDNITIFKRENVGYDFGAYSYAIKNIKKKYDYYFFMNTSVCGPYLDKHHIDKKWYEYFLELFNNSDIKLVGTSINIYNYNLFRQVNLKTMYNKVKPFTHIQSMFFCIDNEYYTYLKELDFFNENECVNGDMTYIIAHKEFGLSQLAIKNGWNINSILSRYKNHDYRTLEKLEGNMGDPYFKDKYFGGTIDKYEVIFFKNARF